MIKHTAVCGLVHCDLCQRTFKSTQYLRQHISKIHDEGREVRRDFDCDLCQVSFTTKHNLIQHTKAFHGMELMEHIKPKTEITKKEMGDWVGPTEDPLL